MRTRDWRMVTMAMGCLMAAITGAHAQDAREFTRDYEAGTLQVTLVAPEIVRVRLVPRGADAAFPRIPLVLPQPATADRFAVRARDNDTELRASKLTVHVHRNAPRVDFYDSTGRTLSLDADGASGAGDSRRDVRAIQQDEQFFGFGLQFHSFAQRGKTKSLKVNADPRDDVGNSHAVVPFFLSTAGYGIFLDSHSYTRFDMGSAAPDRLLFQTPDPILDYYFCYGPTFHDLLERYTRLTGRMAMPPKWGLGFWYRMKSDWDADKVEATAQAFRERRIPCDVIGLEPKWQTHAYSCSYLWNKAFYPDPPAFVKWMRDRSFHVNLWEHAYVHPTSPIHDPLLKAGDVADKPVWGGLVPDFTRADTRQKFADLHRKEHIALGVDGYKLDECDGSDYTGGWFFPDDTKFPSGMTGAQMHNVFGYLYQKSFYEMFAKQNHRTYQLVRGMYAGGQAYPSVVYSDWYAFKDYIRAACNSGFSGILWCPEIRQTANTDEFVRRFQAVFFSPLAMINAWADGVTPWEKGPEVERIFRIYADLRMELAPYLYSAFWKMHETGLPVVRALVVDYPDDRDTYNIDDEFLYGDALLVAPILSGSSRTVYLPKGPWRDWWTGELYEGEKTFTYTAPLDRLPLFVKAGEIVPMHAAMSYSGEKHVDTLQLRVYPGVHTTDTTVYDDDGQTLDYEHGENVTMRVTCEPGTDSITLTTGAPRSKATAQRTKLDETPTSKATAERAGLDDTSRSKATADGARPHDTPRSKATAGQTRPNDTPGSEAIAERARLEDTPGSNATADRARPHDTPRSKATAARTRLDDAPPPAKAAKTGYAPEWKRIEWQVAGLSAEPLSVRNGRRTLGKLPPSAPSANGEGRGNDPKSRHIEGYRYDPQTHTLTIQTPYGKPQTIHIILHP